MGKLQLLHLAISLTSSLNRTHSSMFVVLGTYIPQMSDFLLCPTLSAEFRIPPPASPNGVRTPESVFVYAQELQTFAGG
jgi:hypothetical protein